MASYISEPGQGGSGPVYGHRSQSLPSVGDSSVRFWREIILCL